MKKLYSSFPPVAVIYPWKLDWYIDKLVFLLVLWCPCEVHCNTLFVLNRGLFFLRLYRHQIHDSTVSAWIFHWLSAQHLLTCLTCNIPLFQQTVCHCTSVSGASQCPTLLPLVLLLIFLLLLLLLLLLIFTTNRHHHGKLARTLVQQIYTIQTPTLHSPYSWEYGFNLNTLI